jgi:hypothetical protein
METCLICGKECVTSLRRHVAKSHDVVARDYVLRFELNGVVPLCLCGCGREVTWHQPSKRFNTYVHGHHAQFRKKSDEEKAKIGSANSVNQKRHFANNPEAVRQKVIDLRSGRTDETYLKVSASVRRFWASDSEETRLARKKASEHACNLIEQGLIGLQAPYKQEWKWNPFTEREEFMGSSWETAFLDECIANRLSVTKSHGLRIPYVQADGSEHNYLPDFVSIEHRTVFEIKGYDDRDVEVHKLAALRVWAEENGYQVVKLRARNRHRVELGFVECA